MEKVAAFYAKTHFSNLLDQVENGKEITITRRGEPIARLVPIQGETELKNKQTLIEQIKKLRIGQDQGKKTGTTINELRAAGRR